MDLFRWLLGTLEQTVDYISTFTTYLLGDEAYPGAGTSGRRTETVPQESHHESNVETAHYGDVSPKGNLKAFKGPTIAEIIPPNQEAQEVSGKAFTCAEDTEVILGLSTSPCKYEGHEDVGQKPSEAPNFLPDVPKPRSTAARNIQQRDLEGPTVAGGFHQRETEGSTGMRAVQQGLLEEMADVKDWKPEKPLDGGQASLSASGETEGTQQREQEENEADDREVPGGGEQRGLDQAERTGGFQHEVAKIIEDQHSEADGRLTGGAKSEDSQPEEPYIEAQDEGIQPDGAEPGRHQQGEEVARSSLQWGSQETVYLEGQEGDAERASGKGDCPRRGLEKSEMERLQQGELEGFVMNEREQRRKQEETEAEATGGEASEVEEQKGLLRVAWAGGLQQEVAKMAEGQWLETEGPLAGQAGAENDQKWELVLEAGDEGVQQAMPEGAYSRGYQQQGQEGEAGIGGNLQWEPEETATSEEHLDKGSGQQQGLERAGEGGGYQPGELEELMRSGVESGEAEQKDQIGKAQLEKDQQADPETLVGVMVLEEVVAAAVSEEPEMRGQEPQNPEGTEGGLPQEPLGYNAPLRDTCRLAGAGPFPDEAPFLDTSAQKERVLLRRKSSIRRAPSLKRLRPPVETPLETGVAEDLPSQPPASSRPNLRHPGFGPMHPNMMAELQLRLRRPQ